MLLDHQTLKRHLVAIQQCTTRPGLDKLTRLLWREYSGNPANKQALAQLQTRIECQRAILNRNNPR